jgi:hypothetical protein
VVHVLVSVIEADVAVEVLVQRLLLTVIVAIGL